ncbi:MAG: TonB-dependent receptor [Thermodesulfobacteriota bacterium]|nr:TonB-dependent receptor [Thermodesulfobacteriota bacterium]
MRSVYFLAGILFAVILILTLDSSGFAGNDSEPVEMETMTITATKSEKAIDGVSASVVVIGEKEIETMGAFDLKNIFEKTPGLTIQYGTFPAASSASKSSISIRGLGFFGTLFLIDGRRLANELPSYDLDRLPASMIERIEIIKGPMSVLYGADAVGGVVNIITKKPKKGLQASIDVKAGMNSGGEAENANAGFDIRGKRNNFSYSFYANASSKRPYTEGETTNTFIKTPTGKVKPSVHPDPFIRQNVKDSYGVDVTYREDSKVLTVGSRLEYDIAAFATVGAEFNYFDEDLEGKYRSAFFPTNISPAPGKKIVGLDTPVHSTDDNERLDWGVDSKINIGTDLTLNLRIYRSDYEKRNTTTAINWEDMGYSSEDDSEQTRMAMNANVVFTSYEGYGVYALTDSQLLTIGGEYREEERRATLFNNEGTLENRDIDYKAVYVQDEWQITDTLSAIFGGRYDDIENADSEETFMAGFVKNFSSLFNLRANFAQGYRTPNILELYFRKATPVGYNLGAEVAEPSVGKIAHGLDPEFTNSYEAALSGRHGGFNYEIVFFYNDIEDKIQKVSKTDYFTYENVSDAETKGLEVSIGYQFENGPALNMNWLELDTENKETGKDLEFNPERTVSLSVDYQLNDQILLGMQTVYIGEQRYAKGTVDHTTDDYTLVNLTASYAFGDKNAYEIYGGVNNVFDEDVDTIIGSNVGTYFFTGLRASF